MSLALSILASSAVCPAQLFYTVVVLGNGACLFNAACVGRGDDPAELRRRVVQRSGEGVRRMSIQSLGVLLPNIGLR